MGNGWVGGNHDEDSDDKLLDQMGATYRRGPGGQPPRKPPNRSCALVLIAGAGGAAALAVAAAEAVSRLT